MSVVRDFEKAFNRRDVEGLVACFTPIYDPEKWKLLLSAHRLTEKWEGILALFKGREKA